MTSGQRDNKRGGRICTLCLVGSTFVSLSRVKKKKADLSPCHHGFLVSGVRRFWR